MGIVFSSIVSIVAILALAASGGVSAYAASKADGEGCKKTKDISIINAVCCFILAILLFLFLLF